MLNYHADQDLFNIYRLLDKNTPSAVEYSNRFASFIELIDYWYNLEMADIITLSRTEKVLPGL